MTQNNVTLRYAKLFVACFCITLFIAMPSTLFGYYTPVGAGHVASLGAKGQPPVEPTPGQAAIGEDYSKVELDSREAITAFMLHKNPDIDPHKVDLIIDAMYEASAEYGVDVEYIVALAAVESDFRPGLINEKSCVGLMQVNTKVWLERDALLLLKEAGVLTRGTHKEVITPHTNIRVGTFILSMYMDEGREKGRDPLKYGLTRYYGGKRNQHYKKVILMLGEFYKFTKQTSRSQNAV